MEGRIIGCDPRVLIVDEAGRWSEVELIEALGDLGGRVVIGIDLASDPEPLELSPPLIGMRRQIVAEPHRPRQDHPTTARELRRAERRRRR